MRTWDPINVINMSEESINKLRQALTDIRAAADTSMLWTWDKRYRTALLAIKPEFAEPIETNFKACFSDTWNAENHASSGDAIESLIGFLAGLQDGQMLYTKTIDGGLIIFATFWPWAGNTNVSIRVGAYRASEESSLGLSEIVEELKSVFGIEA